MSDVTIKTSELEGSTDQRKAYLVAISGQLDETNVDEKAKEIYALIDQNAQNLLLLLDLSELTYMNSKSIGYLTDWYTKVSEHGGKLAICQAQDNVLDVLSVVGITNLIQHYTTLDEAKTAIMSA
jgi:stage II sporulation protein AA (anti-sigma F factor antagonist)